MVIRSESIARGRRMAEGPKLTRETYNGFDVFREPDVDGKPGQSYVGQDIEISFSFHRYRLIGSTLSNKDADEAMNHSRFILGNRPETYKALGLAMPGPEDRLGPDTNHVYIQLNATVHWHNDDWSGLALVSTDGIASYTGTTELFIRVGPEEHSHLIHHKADPTYRMPESVFLSVFVRRERLEWLYRELTWSPRASFKMKATLSAFEAHNSKNYETLFSRKWLYVEPETATRISDLSFYVWQPESVSADYSSQAEHIPSETLDNEREKWSENFKTSLKTDDCEPWRKRCANVLDYSSQKIAKWCDDHGEGVKRFAWRLDEAEQFMRSVDGALRDGLDKFLSERDLWRHLDFSSLLKKTTPSQREEFTNAYLINECADTYITNPYLQNDHLDWLLLDVMTAQKAVLLLEALLIEKHGMGYGLLGVSRWKLLLWKAITWPLALIVGWILPAVGFYFLALWSLTLGLTLGAAYYGLSLFMLVNWSWHKVSTLFTGRSSTRRLTNQLEEIDHIYPLLSQDVIHVATLRESYERAASKGLIFDQRIFYVLDGLAQRNPAIWRNPTRSFVGSSF